MKNRYTTALSILKPESVRCDACLSDTKAAIARIDAKGGLLARRFDLVQPAEQRKHLSRIHKALVKVVRLAQKAVPVGTKQIPSSEMLFTLFYYQEQIEAALAELAELSRIKGKRKREKRPLNEAARTTAREAARAVQQRRFVATSDDGAVWQAGTGRLSLYAPLLPQP